MLARKKVSNDAEKGGYWAAGRLRFRLVANLGLIVAIHGKQKPVEKPSKTPNRTRESHS